MIPNPSSPKLAGFEQQPVMKRREKGKRTLKMVDISM